MKAVAKTLGMVSLFTLMSSGCGSALNVQFLQPSAVNLGSTQHLSVVQTEGRRSARETIILELQDQARSRGYFTIDDKSEEGIELKVMGRVVEIESGDPGLEMGHMGIFVDVIDWGADREEIEKKDSEGNVRRVDVFVGEVVLGVTVFDHMNKAILAESEYEGTSEMGAKDASKDEATEMAAKNAVANLLGDITPRPMTARVKLDTKDKGQKTIIQTAKKGNISQAAKDLEGYVQSNENPAAYYNLAVFTDAMGNYAKAIEYYDKAISMSDKGFYSTARAECAKRLAAAEALAN